MPIRALTPRGSLATSMPATVALPESMVRMPSIISRVVVLPAPFGPRMPNTSPLATSKLTPSTACSVPYFLRRSRAISTGPLPAGAGAVVGAAAFGVGCAMGGGC